MYICPKCKWGQFHHLGYCVKCPSRLEKREIIASDYPFKTKKDLINHLVKHGCNYDGREYFYREVPVLNKLKADLDYANEALKKLCLTKQDDLEQIAKIEKQKTFWEFEISDLKKKLFELEQTK
jgi:hypothetical protein